MIRKEINISSEGKTFERFWGQTNRRGRKTGGKSRKERPTNCYGKIKKAQGKDPKCKEGSEGKQGSVLRGPGLSWGGKRTPGGGNGSTSVGKKNFQKEGGFRKNMGFSAKRFGG